ncbi:MAG: carbohydrate ABC transporter permease [Bifidobacteriaceae bacterium]|nr:carbohydrate ABC transporter permease [Bifidobacteriaceae bacterium]
MKVSRLETTLNHAFLVVLDILVLVPVVWFALIAVSPNRAGLIRGVNLGNFAEAWVKADFAHTMAASAVITVGSVVLQGVLSITAGYAFSVLGFPGQRAAFALVLLGLMISLEAILVPLYYQMRDLGLTDSWLGMILIHAGTGIPFGIFWMRAVFRDTSPALIDAAHMDGAGSWRTLWRVLVPINAPAVLTLCLLNFMWTWNDYFLSLIFLASPTKTTATVALSNFQGVHATSVNLLAAAALTVSAPVVILYLFFQRRFVAGIVSGGVKE